MSPEQKTLVQETWQQVAPLAHQAALLFYERLFATDTTTRPLFGSTDLAEQRRKLIQALTLVVRGLNHTESLVPSVAKLGRQHARLGVSDKHYDSVGAALLWTLKQKLGWAGRRKSKRLGPARSYSWRTSCARPGTAARVRKPA